MTPTQPSPDEPQHQHRHHHDGPMATSHVLPRLPTFLAGGLVSNDAKHHFRFLHAIDHVRATHSTHGHHHHVVLDMNVVLKEPLSVVLASSSLMGFPPPHHSPAATIKDDDDDGHDNDDDDDDDKQHQLVLPITRSFALVHGLHSHIREQMHRYEHEQRLSHECDFCGRVRKILHDVQWPHTWMRSFTSSHRKQQVSEEFLNAMIEASQSEHHSQLGEGACDGCSQIPSTLAKFLLDDTHAHPVATQVVPQGKPECTTIDNQVNSEVSRALKASQLQEVV